jgi:hypothetical protein
MLRREYAAKLIEFRWRPSDLLLLNYSTSSDDMQQDSSRETRTYGVCWDSLLVGILGPNNLCRLERIKNKTEEDTKHRQSKSIHGRRRPRRMPQLSLNYRSGISVKDSHDPFSMLGPVVSGYAWCECCCGMPAGGMGYPPRCCCAT